MEYVTDYASPIGKIMLAGDGDALTGLWFYGQKYFAATLDKEYQCTEISELAIFEEAKKWLDGYFSGNMKEVPKLAPRGSAFRKAVWKILLEIPCGETITYREVAERIAIERGLERMSAQAVGGAVGHNPIGIIIPCHRVVGSDGSLTGYAGGMEKKEWLLRWEKANL